MRAAISTAPLVGLGAGDIELSGLRWLHDPLRQVEVDVERESGYAAPLAAGSGRLCAYLTSELTARHSGPVLLVGHCIGNRAVSTQGKTVLLGAAVARICPCRAIVRVLN